MNMPKKKTASIVIDSIKDPDGWSNLISALDLTEAKRKKHFKFSEYASVEIEVDQDLNIVGGRILPLR
jgi:hypothetical protein